MSRSVRPLPGQLRGAPVGGPGERHSDHSERSPPPRRRRLWIEVDPDTAQTPWSGAGEALAACIWDENLLYSLGYVRGMSIASCSISWRRSSIAYCAMRRRSDCQSLFKLPGLWSVDDTVRYARRKSELGSLNCSAYADLA